MPAIKLDLPQPTREWLNAQAGGSAEALRRILEETTAESGRELLGVGDLTARSEPWRHRLDLGPTAWPLASVCVMRAHLRDLIDALAERLGWEEAAALAVDRCRDIPEHPEVASWKRIIVTVHRLLEEDRGSVPAGSLRSVEPSDIELDDTAGDPFFIRGVAITLKRASVEETLHAIHGHLGTTLKITSAWNHPGRKRMTSADMLLRLEAWGCSAHAQIACHLARACDIPAILVKTLSGEWIEEGNQGDGRASGHVYLEVLIADKPALWDAQGGRLHRDYDPGCRMAPGGHQLIYDKGGPDEVVLFHHGEEWDEETKRLFPVPIPLSQLTRR